VAGRPHVRQCPKALAQARTQEGGPLKVVAHSPAGTPHLANPSRSHLGTASSLSTSKPPRMATPSTCLPEVHELCITVPEIAGGPQTRTHDHLDCPESIWACHGGCS
jgi:hypothetical protein